MARKTTVPRKRRPGRIARQADLLTIVYKVLSEVGIDAASLRQIADRAKVSTGTISYHFENKEKLVMAALQAARCRCPTMPTVRRWRASRRSHSGVFCTNPTTVSGGSG